MPSLRDASSARPGEPRSTRRRAILAAAFGLCMAACSDKPGAPNAQGTPGAAPPALPVTLLKVAPTRAPLAIEAVAQTEGAREVEVRARVSGILEKRLYEEGAPVKAGQVLYRIERAPYEIALSQAKAQLSEQRARLEQASREAERLKGLLSEKAISQKEYDDASLTNAVAKAALQSAEAAVSQAELNLSYTSVTAPVSGMTGRSQRSEGTLVNSVTDSLLTTIVQLDPIWVRFSLPESDIARLPGKRVSTASIKAVELVLPDGSLYPHKGRINFSASRLDARLGTQELRAEFPNDESRVLPGQFVKVRLVAGEQDNVFLVPQSAVVSSDQGRMVFLRGANGTVEPRPISAGEWLGKDWIITGGLKPGDEVITDNLLKLRPGAPVVDKATLPPPAQPGAGAPAAAAPADKPKN